MQPHLVRALLVLTVTTPLWGCHGRSNDGGGLVNVRTNDGVRVRAPFVNVHVPTRGAEIQEEVTPAPLPPPTEISPD